MEYIFQNIITFVSNKTFIIPLIAVFFAWLLTFFPQRNQNIQRTVFELMKNQLELLKRIEYKDKSPQSYFVQVTKILEFLYSLISSDYADTTSQNSDDMGGGNYTDYGNKINMLSKFDNELSVNINDFYIRRPIKDNDEDNISFERKKAKYVYDYFFFQMIYCPHHCPL